MTDAAKPGVPQELLQKLHAVQHWRHWVRIVLFVALYAAGAAGATWIAARHGWLFAIPLYLLAGASCISAITCIWVTMATRIITQITPAGVG